MKQSSLQAIATASRPTRSWPALMVLALAVVGCQLIYPNVCRNVHVECQGADCERCELIAKYNLMELKACQTCVGLPINTPGNPCHSISSRSGKYLPRACNSDGDCSGFDEESFCGSAPIASNLCASAGARTCAYE